MAVVAIAAGVAAVGAYAGAVSGRKSATKARRAQSEAGRKAKKYIRPENIIKTTQQVQPLFREAMASGPGAQMQQQVQGNLSAHGLTGTGVGEALRNASFALPEIEAFRQALQMGYDIQKQKAAITLGSAPTPSMFYSGSPFGEALSAGAGAYFTGKNLMGGGGQVAQAAGPTTTTPMYNPMDYLYRVK